MGFVLTRHDPYAVLDLDNKEHNPASAEELAYFGQLIQAFASYTELSRSGRGVHVVMRGHCDRNAKRGRVELYHDKRFIICTGNVCPGFEVIHDRPEQIDALLESLPQTIDEQLRELPQTVATKPDQDVLEGMARCDIGANIRALWEGRWQGDYASQSEADLALIGHLWWWSRDVDQTKKLFRLSALGQRSKAQRNDYYVDYSLRRIIANEPPPVDLSGLERPQPKQAVEISLEAPKGKHTPNYRVPAVSEVPAIPNKPRPAPFDKNAWAPGFLGEVEQWLYNYAIRQNREVATVTALGVFAGMCGRSWNVSGTGLNLYLLLLSGTGTGKENISSGSEAVFNSIRGTIPAATDFLGPSMFASGQGLIRFLDDQPCFLSVIGEFGQFMSKLQAKNENAAMLKLALLNLYNKSGAGDMLRPTVYSSSDKNTHAVVAPAVTLVGESAPAPFLAHLSPELLEEGFVPRFLVIQSDAQREPQNQNARQPMPPTMVAKLADIANTAMMLQARKSFADVGQTDAAREMLDEYNTECDHKINHAHMEAERQIWTRAYVKALRVAALLAVADNHESPIITIEHAKWAIGLTRKDATDMVYRFATGDYGTGEPKQLVDLRRITEQFFEYSEDDLVVKYGVPRGMQAVGFIPHCYYQRRTASLSAFRNTTKGATMALQIGLQALMASGELQELNRVHGQPFNYTGKLYGRPQQPT